MKWRTTALAEADWDSASAFSADAVQRIAEMNLDMGYIADIVTALNSEGFTLRGEPWDFRAVRDVIVRLWPYENWTNKLKPNPGYVGPLRENPEWKLVQPLSDADLADATLIADVFAAARRWQDVTGRPAPRKPLREVLWYFWQSRRPEGPRFRGKYPLNGNWTKAAREAHPELPDRELR